jgi:phosphatidate cytidylyltransferase
VTTRIIVGLIAAPIVLAPIWFGGIWALLLILFVALFGGLELYAMLEQGGYRPVRLIGLIWIAALVLAGWQPTLPLAPPLISLGLILVLVFALFQPEKPVTVWMGTSIAAIYLGLMLGQALALRLLSNGLWWFLFALLITWINDTAAYFVGVTLGRHKLWPRLSPKKTWEGTLGGWVAAGMLGGILALFTPLEPSFFVGALLGMVSGIFALLGDLSISMVKRQVGVKDSGHFFPGHGGMLDRIDSILFVLPFVYQVVRWLHL